MKIAFLKKIPKQKLQQVVLVCIVILAAVVGVVELYVLKNWTELTDTDASITKLADQIREGERQARGAQQDVAHRAEVKLFVEAQQAAMVSGDPFAWVVREISLLAEQHPVRITALHPGQIGCNRRIQRPHLRLRHRCFRDVRPDWCVCSGPGE